MHFWMQLILILIGIYFTKFYLYTVFYFAILAILRAGEKFRADYLKFYYSNKRAFVGMSSIKTADVTLRMPSMLAELVEDFFLVSGCLFQFISLVLHFRAIFVAI